MEMKAGDNTGSLHRTENAMTFKVIFKSVLSYTVNRYLTYRKAYRVDGTGE